MKTNKQKSSSNLFRAGFLLFTMALFVQCEGPQGPRGYDGDAFAYSVTYNVFPEDWVGDADGYDVFLDVPEITNDIYDNGAVLVYRLIEDEPKSFNQLPYTYVDNGFTIYMDFDAYVGGIDLIYKEILDGVNDTFAPEGVMPFKIVIIEGIPLATVKTMVDVKDYQAVSRTFKINETSSGVHVF